MFGIANNLFMLGRGLVFITCCQVQDFLIYEIILLVLFLRYKGGLLLTFLAEFQQVEVSYSSTD